MSAKLNTLKPPCLAHPTSSPLSSENGKNKTSGRIQTRKNLAFVYERGAGLLRAGKIPLPQSGC